MEVIENTNKTAIEFDHEKWNELQKAYSVPTVEKMEIIVPLLESEECKDFFLNKSILDTGCGPGHIAKTLAEKYPIKGYLGIDNSANAIEYARQQRIDAVDSDANINFVRGNILSLPIKENSFDTALSINVIPTITSSKEVSDSFCGIFQSLRNNGSLLLIVMNEGAIKKGGDGNNLKNSILEETENYIKHNLSLKKVDGTYLNIPADICWRTDYIKKELELAGFTISHVEELGNETLRPLLYIHCKKVEKNRK